jgi:hypothetical protein
VSTLHVSTLSVVVAMPFTQRFLFRLEHSNRAAQLQSKDITADVDPCLTNFKPNESWPELRDHWSAAHPTESERLAGLNYEELSRLRDSRAVPPVIQS